MHRFIWNERPRIELKKTTLTAVLGKVQKFSMAMRKTYFPMLNGANPLHYLGLLTFKVLTYRMHIVVLHLYASNAARLMPERLRQIMLEPGLEQLEAAIAMETTPSLKMWRWYSGAFQQYHTALLLFAELYATPVHHQADRIWKCLDYIFELPAELERVEKARLILSGLSSRAALYQSLRKLRAPTFMEHRVGPRPVIRTEQHTSPSASDPIGSLSPNSLDGSNSLGSIDPTPLSLPTAAGAAIEYFGAPGGILSGGAELRLDDVANEEAPYAPPVQASSQHSPDQSSGFDQAHTVSVGTSHNVAMPDIDWVSRRLRMNTEVSLAKPFTCLRISPST